MILLFGIANLCLVKNVHLLLLFGMLLLVWLVLLVLPTMLLLVSVRRAAYNVLAELCIILLQQDAKI